MKLLWQRCPSCLRVPARTGWPKQAGKDATYEEYSCRRRRRHERMKIAPGARIAWERAWLRSVSELWKGSALEAMRPGDFLGGAEWLLSLLRPYDSATGTRRSDQTVPPGRRDAGRGGAGGD